MEDGISVTLTGNIDYIKVNIFRGFEVSRKGPQNLISDSYH
jgi:hypothetical protein